MQSELYRAPQTVLIVDDYEAVLAIVTEFLRAQGFFVLAANKGSEARSLAESHSGRIDLLLIEARLSDASGLVVSEQLKLQHPNMAVIIMSAALDATNYQRCVESLNAQFLWKPFTNAELLDKITEVTEPRKNEFLGSL